jgi:hypothetical protein
LALSGISYGLQCRTKSIWKQSSKVSYSLSGIDQPPHKRGRVSSLFCALLHNINYLNIFLVYCCLLFSCISFVSDSVNDGVAYVSLYMSCSLSIG